MDENCFRGGEFGITTLPRYLESASVLRELKIVVVYPAQLDLDNELARGGNEDVDIWNPKWLARRRASHVVKNGGVQDRKNDQTLMGIG